LISLGERERDRWLEGGRRPFLLVLKRDKTGEPTPHKAPDERGERGKDVGIRKWQRMVGDRSSGVIGEEYQNGISTLLSMLQIPVSLDETEIEAHNVLLRKRERKEGGPGK